MQSAHTNPPAPQPLGTQPPSRRRPFIFALPPEMIDEILIHLPIVSQACLVFSCKRFYRLFNFVLSDRRLQWPHSDGPDDGLDPSSRIQVLMVLESQQWKCCAACLKLHPSSDFNQDSPGYNDPTLRTCQWPGMIVLCPCLKFRSKSLGDLASQISQNFDERPDTWHHCEFLSRDGTLSYELKISLSLDSCGWVVFNFHYAINVDPLKCHGVKRRIMLCPHIDAFEQIQSKGRSCANSESMECKQCIMSTKTTLSDDLTTYKIQFTRCYGPHHGIPIAGRAFNDIKWDYNWRRYNIFPQLSTSCHGQFNQQNFRLERSSSDLEELKKWLRVYRREARWECRSR